MTPRKPTPPPEPDGLPIWVTIASVVTLLGALVFNVLVYGEDGYPTTVVLGGLLGGLFGLDKLKRRG